MNFQRQIKLETMEGYEYSSSEQDSSSIFSQFGSHCQETASQLPASTLTEKTGQIMGFTSPHATLQTPTGQVIRPSAFKVAAMTVSPTLGSQQNAQHQHPPFQTAASHCIEHNTVSDVQCTDLVLRQAETSSRKEERLVDKRRQIKRKRPRAVPQDVEVHDVDGPPEKQSTMRWKDSWVVQLIHIRGSMHKIFSSPQKQRVDLWQTVYNELLKVCSEFDKDSEACRKKWRRVFKDYKDDKHANTSSGNERSQKCRFYELIDSYMRDRANVICNTHTSAQDGDTPLVKVAVEVKAKDTTSQIHATSKPHLIEKTVPNSIHSMLSEIVSIGKEMLQTTKEIEKEKLAVLNSLKDTLGEIAKKI